jgi:hypothetical protein
MRSTHSLSLAAWAAVAAATLSFSACAKGVASDVPDVPGENGAVDDAGSASTTQTDPFDDAASSSSQSNPDTGSTGANPTDDAGSPSDDAGPTSSGDDAGAPVTPDSGSTTGGVDSSAPPPTLDVCPDTSKYQTEYDESWFFDAVCTTNADCSSLLCCYNGIKAAYGGGCVLK